MKPGIGALVVAISYFLILVFAVTITENTVQITTLDISIGNLIINAGVYYSIVNSVLVTIVGTVDNAGGFYVTSANGLTSSVVMTGGYFVNSGVVSFNSMASPLLSTYDIATVGSFDNTGDMYFGISGATLIGSPFIVTSVTSWSNTGMMVFRRESSGGALLVIEQVLGDGGLSRITNDGSICLYNTYWLQTTSIDGTGCITVGPGAEMGLQLAVGELLFSLAETQTVYLASSNSVLSILGLSVSLIPDNPIKVAGFGGGNSIQVNLVFIGNSYDPSTGILTLSLTGLLLVEFDIGLGYQSSGFSASPPLLNRRITYNDPAPNEIPDTCFCLFTFPDVTTTALSSATSVPTSSEAPTSSEV
ncbi:hypothetical protein METBIDRAFT_46484, partial [Metschnikowia bicuspidata var. bicuspidata NRRL YB-4993]